MPVVMEWLGSAEELLLWGGPGLIYGLDAEGFAEQIRLDEVNSWVLQNNQKGIVGFGQYYERLDRIHFGRIGIDKAKRGEGLSHVLMSKLINEATKNDNREMSLFVMRDNIPAVKCYERLGFFVSQYPDAMPDGMNNVEYRVNDRSRG